jgi:hypothetical protein
MEIMHKIGCREPRWIAGVICILLAGSASAEGVSDAGSTSVLLASIAPMPVETLSPIPDPGQYVFHYEMEYSSYQEAAAGLDSSAFYAAPVAASARAAVLAPDPLHLQLQTSLPTSGHAFNTVKPTVSFVDMFQLMDDGTGTAAHPPRRLAMMVDDWRLSASAHIPLLRQRDTGATVSVQRKF